MPLNPIQFKFVKRPNYVLYGPSMSLEELFCKVCGTAIGGLVTQVKGTRITREGKQIEEQIIRFRRYHNYVEVKMQFEDGSYHVTCGCNQCMSVNLTPEQLDELHQADMSVEEEIYPGQEEHMARKAAMVVAIRTDGGGII